MKKIMGVIGNPIKHSLSPVMHEAAYKALGLKDMAYHAFKVTPNQLEAAINGIRGLGLLGVNVTIPHKIAVIPFLDEIDDLAKEIGAVNTIVNVNGYLKGYNTDGEGYLQSLLKFIEGDLHDRKVLVIGAGGAARAVSLTIAKYGVKEIVITNRTEQKGRELVESLRKFGSASFLPAKNAEGQLHRFGIIINTTSIGMTPNVSEVPLPLNNNLSQATVVSDLIYTPLKTKWLKEAEENGARILSGLDMFIYQGALAFKHWTDHEAPIDVMRQSVLKQLQGGTQ